MVKAHVLDPQANIDNSKPSKLKGITEQSLPSLGVTTTMLQLPGCSMHQEFHVVASDFPITQDGILGRDLS